MKLNVVGKSVQRLDAVEKVTGRARYSEDFFERDMLVGKVLRSPHAHALVKRIDAGKALALPGVEAVLTARDLPAIKFPTAGHPWSLDVAHRDVADRLILTDKARFVGDAVAAVVAVDLLTAEKALHLIEVEYEVLPFVLTPEDAMKEGAPVLHAERPDNIVSSFGTQYGDIEAEMASAERVFEGEYETSIVQHCHLENQTAFAFVDTHGRIVINSSTQIPHIVRRIVAQALGLRWGKVQVIKPYIGGGFGAKQDVVIEPLVAAMSLAVHGRPVRLTFTREEVFIDSRTRHAMKIHLRIAASNSGKLHGIEVKLLSNTGAYASHGHSIAMSSGSKFRPLYHFRSFKFEPKTVYTNLPVAGAMRGYGVPQMFFALESLLEDIARELKLDPIEFRRMNLISEGHQDPLTKNVVRSFGIPQCIEKGKALIRWDEKKKEYAGQTGHLRRGLGMACFSYASGTHPVGLELAGARIVMHQDGSVTLQVGATEIGQGIGHRVRPDHRRGAGPPPGHGQRGHRAGHRHHPLRHRRLRLPADLHHRHRRAQGRAGGAGPGAGHRRAQVRPGPGRARHPRLPDRREGPGPAPVLPGRHRHGLLLRPDLRRPHQERRLGQRADQRHVLRGHLHGGRSGHPDRQDRGARTLQRA